MTNDELKEIEARANAAKDVYDGAAEHRNVALANYTMGEEYITDIPALIAAIRERDARIEKLVELAKEAESVLSNYWFTEDEYDSWNNEDVIAITYKLRKALEADGKGG